MCTRGWETTCRPRRLLPSHYSTVPGGTAESRMAASDQRSAYNSSLRRSQLQQVLHILLLVGEMWIVSGGMDSAGGESAVRRFRGPGI